MKKGFTLAEVLITLIIVGVVAALTIPNLMQKYTEQTTVKKVQKFYSNLSNAYNLAMKDNGAANEWNVTYSSEGATKIYNLLFKPYFKIAKDCKLDNKGNCISRTYTYLNKSWTSYYGNSTDYHKIALDDGATIWFTGSSDFERYNALIYYDVNGAKAPNQWGKDLFHFIIKNDKVFPAGIPSGEYAYANFTGNCNRESSGIGCTAWLIYKGNMDYLHCDGLTWKSHSCKEK